MKRKNIRILQTIALLAGIAVCGSTAAASGQLGQRYLKATLDGVFWDNDSGLDEGLGATLTFNQPLAKTFDLGLGYSHINANGDAFEGDSLFFSGTWFTPAANGKLYARGEIGWATVDTPFGENDEWLWALETGLELPLGERITITPFVSYTDGFNSDLDGVFDFGVMADFDITIRTSLVVGASVNDDSDVEVNGGVVFRF